MFPLVLVVNVLLLRLSHVSSLTNLWNAFFNVFLHGTETYASDLAVAFSLSRHYPFSYILHKPAFFALSLDEAYLKGKRHSKTPQGHHACFRTHFRCFMVISLPIDWWNSVRRYSKFKLSENLILQNHFSKFVVQQERFSRYQLQALWYCVSKLV